MRSLLFLLAFAPGLARADVSVQRAASPTDLLDQIAHRLEEMRSDAHLRQFDPKRHRKPTSIEYRNGVTEVPNPDYDRLTREAEEEERRRGPMMRGMIPRTVPRYAERDGIDLQIRLERVQDVRRQQAVVFEWARLGDWALIVSIGGADVKPMKDLRMKIHRLIDEEVARVGGTVRPRAF
jgi:hypothetical protein